LDSSILLNVSFETAQVVIPKGLIISKPIVDRTQWFAVQFANTGRALLIRQDQAGGSQQTKVFRDCRTAGRKIGGDLTNGLPATAEEQGKDPAAGWISDSPEDGVSFVACDCNHLVTDIVT
jgi:hypothetical protein